MTEIETAALSVEDIETEATELTVEDIVTELVDTVFGEDTTITPYKVSRIVNGTFEALDNEKRIPPQMMYNYSRNGLLVKGEKGIKALTKDQAKAFTIKYVTKHTN
jgi:hypothetical protein